MNSDIDSRFRAASYWVIGVGLTGALLLGHGVGWRGSAELHTVMEVIATLLAATVGMMALVRYYSKIDNVFLVIGAGFLGTTTTALWIASRTRVRAMSARSQLRSPTTLTKSPCATG